MECLQITFPIGSVQIMTEHLFMGTTATTTLPSDITKHLEELHVFKTAAKLNEWDTDRLKLQQLHHCFMEDFLTE